MQAKTRGVMKCLGIATLKQLSPHNLIIVMEEHPRVNGTLEWGVVIETTTRACVRARIVII
eukprot:3611784-Ditylum_brightwellii.AAC.1